MPSTFLEQITYTFFFLLAKAESVPSSPMEVRLLQHQLQFMFFYFLSLPVLCEPCLSIYHALNPNVIADLQVTNGDPGLLLLYQHVHPSVEVLANFPFLSAGALDWIDSLPLSLSLCLSAGIGGR